MTTSFAGAQVAAPTTVNAIDTLDRARFLDLVTFRRNGEAVGTPVLFVVDGDRILVRTAHDAGKLKRLAHTDRVEVARSDQRGRRTGPAITGTARVLGPEAVPPMLTDLHAKHPIAGRLFTALRHLRGKGDVVIEISLDAADTETPSPSPKPASSTGLRRAHGAGIAATMLVLAALLAACSGSGAAPTTTDAMATASIAIADGADAGDPITPTDPADDTAPTAAPAAGGSIAETLCRLVPPSDAEAALGEAADEGRAKQGVVFKDASCLYRATGSSANLGIWYSVWPSKDEWATQQAKLGMAADQAVAGLGEAAYRIDPRSGTKLAVFDHGVGITIVINQQGHKDPLAASAERLARQVLDGLDR